MAEDSEVDNEEGPLIMHNKVYDFLKWVSLVLLPAFATLYFAMAQIWHLPNGSEVIATVTALDTFLGALIGISGSQYSKNVANSDAGYINIDTESDTKDVLSLILADKPTSLINKDRVTFKVTQDLNTTKTQ